MTFKKYNIKLKRRVFAELLHKEEAESFFDQTCSDRVLRRRSCTTPTINALKSKQSPYLESFQQEVSTKMSKNDQSEENTTQ